MARDKRWWWLSFVDPHARGNRFRFAIAVEARAFTAAVEACAGILAAPLEILGPTEQRGAMLVAEVLVDASHYQVAGGAIPAPPAPQFRCRKLTETESRLAMDVMRLGDRLGHG